MMASGGKIRIALPSARSCLIPCKGGGVRFDQPLTKRDEFRKEPKQSRTEWQRHDVVYDSSEVWYQIDG